MDIASVQLDINCPHSHPRARNMLRTIRVLVDLLLQINAGYKRLEKVLEQLPYV